MLPWAEKPTPLGGGEVTKYKGFVDLEYEIHPDDPMPGVISSFAYMRGVLAGMGYASQSEAVGGSQAE
jgi:hypothetical protein